MTPKQLRDAANGPWEEPVDWMPYCGECGRPNASRGDHECGVDCDHSGAMTPGQMHEVTLSIGTIATDDRYDHVACSACGHLVYVTR